MLRGAYFYLNDEYSTGLCAEGAGRSLWPCTSGVGGGEKAHPQKFWFVENLGKIYEKFAKYLKIRMKMAPNVGRTTWRLFLDVIPNMICVGRNTHTNSLGKFGQKSLTSPKICLLHLCLSRTFYNGQLPCLLLRNVVRDSWSFFLFFVLPWGDVCVGKSVSTWQTSGQVVSLWA